MQTFTIKPFDMPVGAAALRAQVRNIIAGHVTDGDIARRANCWQINDPQFSRVLGKAGLIGMTWPREYGGHERTALERYIVLEELLAAGAPVGAHWIADRQTAPLLLRYGTEEQRRKWVPRIAAGEAYGCIGLSEPNAGSDLASVRSSARRDGDHWVLSGQKIWTTNAHIAHIMIGLSNVNGAVTVAPTWMEAEALDDALGWAAQRWVADGYGPVFANGQPIPASRLRQMQLKATPRGSYNLYDPSRGALINGRGGQPFEFQIEGQATRDALRRELGQSVRTN